MSKEIERNTKLFKKSWRKTNVILKYCYYNTTQNLYFFQENLIKQTKNVSHLVRVEELDLYIYKKEE